MTIDFGSVFKDIIGINWRTTAAAVLPLLTSLDLAVGAIAKGEMPAGHDLAVIASLFSIAWGLISAKDKNVTGGTVSNVDGSTAKPVSLIESGTHVLGD